MYQQSPLYEEMKTMPYFAVLDVPCLNNVA